MAEKHQELIDAIPHIKSQKVHLMVDAIKSQRDQANDSLAVLTAELDQLKQVAQHYKDQCAALESQLQVANKIVVARVEELKEAEAQIEKLKLCSSHNLDAVENAVRSLRYEGNKAVRVRDLRQSVNRFAENIMAYVSQSRCVSESREGVAKDS